MSKHLVIVSCDPGITTGWAIHRFPALFLLRQGAVSAMRGVRCSFGQGRAGSTSGSVDAFLRVARLAYEELTEDGDGFAIVVESFQLRMMNMDPEMLEPVRFAAVIDDRLRGSGQVVSYQTPSDALTTITDQRLGLWGVLDRTRGRKHARDAQRHGLLYARRWASNPAIRSASGWVAPRRVVM